MKTLRGPIIFTARKEHTCNWCNGKIHKGTKYFNSSHVNDNVVYTWKSHEDCSFVAGKIIKYEDYDYGITQDDFLDSIYEKYIELMTSLIEPINNDILQQLRYVPFSRKLSYVIIHYKKIDKNQ